MLLVIFISLIIYGFAKERKENRRNKNIAPDGYPL